MTGIIAAPAPELKAPAGRAQPASIGRPLAIVRPCEVSRRFVPATFVVGALATAKYGAVFEDGPLFLMSEGSFFSTGRKVGRNYTAPAAYASARHAQFNGYPAHGAMTFVHVHFELVVNGRCRGHRLPPERGMPRPVVFSEQLGGHALGCDRLIACLRISWE